MANMSYCRFENTLSDLMDCFRALEVGNFESVTEQKKAQRMLNEMVDFLVDQNIINDVPEDYEERIKEFILIEENKE
jgi:hypothetical protein